VVGLDGCHRDHRRLAHDGFMKRVPTVVVVKIEVATFVKELKDYRSI
jgi:hypothetical protein